MKVSALRTECRHKEITMMSIICGNTRQINVRYRIVIEIKKGIKCTTLSFKSSELRDTGARPLARHGGS